METKTILRKRVQIDCSKPKLTDQSYKKSADINNIMLQYSRTGLLPQVKEKIARYVDNTDVLPLEIAHDKIREARTLFMQLPSDIRKLMDNDPTKLVSFIQNPENADILIKKGVLEKKQVKSIEQSDGQTPADTADLKSPNLQ